MHSSTYNSSPGALELRDLLDSTFTVGTLSDRITRASLRHIGRLETSR